MDIVQYLRVTPNVQADVPIGFADARSSSKTALGHIGRLDTSCAMRRSANIGDLDMMATKVLCTQVSSIYLSDVSVLVACNIRCIKYICGVHERSCGRLLNVMRTPRMLFPSSSPASVIGNSIGA